MKNWILITCIIISITKLLMAQDNDSKSTQVTIENGIIEGSHDENTGIYSYLGIPFAKPPIGKLRWRSPLPPENWKGVKETKKFGPGPMQKNVFGDMIYRSDGLSEDCLYLNVWSPVGNRKSNLPVLVYFYGGGFVAGDASEPRYDGESMAQKGIVVVSVNYRLNIFGFFAHPELSAEAEYKASGNYGLLDQHAALKWVSNNIASFGGDPNHVTIAGESAGSISVSLQMASPLSKNLIAGAIGESGGAIYPTLPPVSLEEAENIGLDLAIKAGYKKIFKLRALSTDEVYEIYKKSKRFGFPVAIDGYFLPGSLVEIFNANKQAQVPLLLGWNSAEIPAMGFMKGKPYNTESYIETVKNAFPNDYEKVLKLYPFESEKEIVQSATALASDQFISYSTWKWFDLHRKNSEQPVYRYLYSKLRPPTIKEPSFKMPDPIGAPHACEIEYCLGNLHLIEKFAWTKEDFKVSEIMQNYFANFIKTGNPNGNNLTVWPAADPNDSNPPVMIIDTECAIEKAIHDTRYEFLDKWYGNK